MRSLSVIACLLFVSVAAGQPPRVPQVPNEFPPQAPELVSDEPEVSQYESNRARSIKSGLPYVLFVGVDPVKVAGAVVDSVDSANGSSKPRVIVSASPLVPGIVLPATATAAQIRAVFERREEVSRQAIPFGKRLRPGEQIADDSEAAAVGRWPKSVPFPREATRYKTAQYTQALYKLEGQIAIDPIPRDRIKMEWQVPGGMENVHGWKSDLFKFVPAGWQRSWLALRPVRNSSGFIQFERGHTRAYPDGAWFADLLSSDGKPFELRIREKRNGAWESYVAFRDRAARPAGYHGLDRTCQSCHVQAGTGEYGVGLIPGGDTVFSEPFDGLEN